MASQTPVLQDENLPIYRGKGVDGVKANMPSLAKKGFEARKALGDLPKAAKPPLSGASTASILKEKSAGHGRETVKKASKSSSLTDEEMKRCHEWAKEGMDQFHFTGNDMEKLRRDKQEERVKKKVEKVMSAMREWNNIAYGIRIPLKGSANDTEDMMKIEVVPEVLPPMTSLFSNPDEEDIEDLHLEPEVDSYPYVDHTFDLKLEDWDNDVLCL